MQHVITSARPLEERVVSCLPAATFEMETLCRLAGIVASDDTPTAAVTCEGRPRLLVNPDFVASHCSRDEHLFLLVMHELYHVILGHTGLYPRPTPGHNVAFDAIINAGLCREFPDPVYLEFFRSLNSPEEFPALLLRPPEGWPDRTRYPEAGPSGTAEVLRRLYPDRGTGARANQDGDLPTYWEILDLLERAQPQGESKEGPGAESGSNKSRPRGRHKPAEPDAVADEEKPDDGRVPTKPLLLGNHDDPEADELAMRDPVLGDVVRRIVANWPPPPIPLGGRDSGSAAQQWARALGPCPEQVRRAFATVIRRVLGPRLGASRRRARAEVVEETGRGVLPNPRDRTRHARRRLGVAGALWVQTGPVRARVPDTPAVAHVYLDVSGSMIEVLDHLLDLVRPYVASGQARVFQFSNRVWPLTARELAKGRVTTTGGTEIDPVLEHLLSDDHVRLALLLTDGYTGAGRSDLLSRLRRERRRIHVVLPAESAWLHDLQPLAASMTVLPPLYPQAPRWRIDP